MSSDQKKTMDPLVEKILSDPGESAPNLLLPFASLLAFMGCAREFIGGR